MEIFKTQFELKDVLTNATVEELEENTFGCIINLVDFFDGGELPINLHDHDLVIKRINQGKWQVVGESKMKLDEPDIQNLGKAIEGERTGDIADS